MTGPIGTKLHYIREGLHPADYCFNPSIIKWGELMLVAYRCQNQLKATDPKILGVSPSQIALGWLDDNFRLPFSDLLNLTEPAEDPRLFTHQDRLYVSYGGDKTLKVARLDGAGSVEKNWTLPNLQDCEKNWTFWSHNGRLYSIYSLAPDYTIIEWTNDFQIKQLHNNLTNELKWPFGQMRGGTPPVPVGNGLLRTFFHSSSYYPVEEVYPHLIYLAGYLDFEPEYPFATRLISSVPILTPPLFDKHDGPIDYSVVFPGGAIRARNKWLVSVGINDAHCAIAELDQRELDLYSRSPRTPQSGGRWTSA